MLTVHTTKQQAELLMEVFAVIDKDASDQAGHVVFDVPEWLAELWEASS